MARSNAKLKIVETPVEKPKKAGTRLDLGCGDNKREGFKGVDFVKTKSTDYVHDLFKFPWPFKTDSVEEVHCLRGDVCVDTPTGARPIKSIRAGDYVLGRTGPTLVLEVLSRRYSGPILSLKAGDSFVEVTAEHPIATPDGWLKADQLREAGNVLGIASEVETADGVNCGYVLDSITGFSTFCTTTPMNVVMRKNPTAESDDYVRLFDFSHKVGTTRRERGHGGAGTAVNLQMEGIPNGQVPMSVSRNTVLASKGSENGGASCDDRCVPVNDGNLALELSRADVQADRAFTVKQPGKIRAVCLRSIEHISSYHFVGEVFNLVTADSTFFAEGLLTHNCSHFFEHIPAKIRPKFMDELYRVLQPEGKVTIICPYFRSVRAIQDFTHEWPPIAENTFLYFNKKWREDNKLTHGHYEMSCDFDFQYGYQMNGVWVNKAEEARNFAISHYWEVVADLHTTLTSRKGKE